jgi:putative ABC transport system substrate-binding protein
MRRREFIILLGGAAAAWPFDAHAQGLVPIVGFAASGSRAVLQDPIAGFEAGLKEMGFVQGQNLALEYRFAEGKFDRFPTLISDLVQRKVAVLVVSSPQGALAAKRATTEIPIVFSIGSDPVEVGLVPSLNKVSAGVSCTAPPASTQIGSSFGEVQWSVRFPIIMDD